MDGADWPSIDVNLEHHSVLSLFCHWHRIPFFCSQRRKVYSRIATDWLIMRGCELVKRIFGVKNQLKWEHLNSREVFHCDEENERMERRTTHTLPSMMRAVYAFKHLNATAMQCRSRWSSDKCFTSLNKDICITGMGGYWRSSIETSHIIWFNWLSCYCCTH